VSATGPSAKHFKPPPKKEEQYIPRIAQPAKPSVSKAAPKQHPV
jgi:hypothetical protein